jgi:HD superfamily phosphodiesterase
MRTAEGRRIAEERHEFMVRFFERLDMEHRGEA